MKHTYLLMTQHQLYRSDITTAITQCAEARGWPEFVVKVALAYDQYVAPSVGQFSVVDDYKKGLLTDPQFFRGIRERLLTNAELHPDATILAWWNSMTTFSDATKERLESLAAYLLKNPSVKLLLVSDTCAIHQRHIED